MPSPLSYSSMDLLHSLSHPMVQARANPPTHQSIHSPHSTPLQNIWMVQPSHALRRQPLDHTLSRFPSFHRLGEFPYRSPLHPVEFPPTAVLHFNQVQEIRSQMGGASLQPTMEPPFRSLVPPEHNATRNSHRQAQRYRCSPLGNPPRTPTGHRLPSSSVPPLPHLFPHFPPPELLPNHAPMARSSPPHPPTSRHHLHRPNCKLQGSPLMDRSITKINK